MAEKEKDEEELPFAEGLSSLGKALSASQEAESTLESLATIAEAAEMWMKVRAKNQDIAKEQVEVETKKGSSFADTYMYNEILNGKSNVTEFFGKNSDTAYTYFKESSVLDFEDPTQSLLGNNWQTNMSALSDVVEVTEFNSFAEAIKAGVQLEQQQQQPAAQNNPNVEAQNQTASLANQLEERKIINEDVNAQKLEQEQNTKPEEPETTETESKEIEVPEAGATDQTETNNVEVEEVATTDAPTENVTDKLAEILEKNKGLGSLLGGAR